MTACGGGSSDSGSANNTTPTPAVTSPSITTQPQSAAVSAGSTATFSVAAGGTAPLSYQWLRNGQAISGATSASYTTAALSTSDNGAVYTVTVTNSTGSQTSSVATLSVTAVATVRAWATGQPLEDGDEAVQLFDAGIDAQGNVVAVFVKSNGTREVLYATRGVPGGSGIAPQWSTPQPIDAAGSEFNLPASFTQRHLSLAVSSNGNAHAVWIAANACTTATYNTNPANVCKYVYSARFLATSGTWESPQLVANTTSASASLGSYATRRPAAFINNAGDIAVAYPGWIAASSQSSIRAAVAWRSNGAANFSVRRFDDLPVDTSTSGLNLPYVLTLDDSGGMTLAGPRNQSTSTDDDIVAYSGSMSSGFGTSANVLDGRGDPARFIDAATAPSGETLVVWAQDDGVSDKYLASHKTSASGTWSQPQTIAAENRADARTLRMASSGNGKLYVNCGVYEWSRSSQTWGALQSMPTSCGWMTSAFATFSQDGGYLIISQGDGIWATYDSTTRGWIHPIPTVQPLAISDYVLGVSGGSTQTGFFGLNSNETLNGLALYSASGIGAYIGRRPYDTLPTARSPNGDGRSGINNLWGLFLK